jgi:microcin C transport system permease protein
MGAYIVRRLLLIIPTLFGILLINFAIVQVAPGGPVEQAIAHIKGRSTQGGLAGSIGASSGDVSSSSTSASSGQSTSTSTYRGAQGLRPELIKEIERRYGFDKPPAERFFLMVRNYLTFNFGTSFSTGKTVTQMIKERLPVSMSLGIWSTLLIYLISIPLGIRKAVKDGSRFDMSTSTGIVILYAIPPFLFAILLIILFAGGSYWRIFPLRGLVSPNWDQLVWWKKILDYFWHLTLPILVLTIGGFASLTLLTKNSFMEEIHKQYVVTARSKGLTERRILYGHVFRNAMLIVISGFPAAIIAAFFTGAILTETIFSINGLGLMSFEAVITRDYPVFLGSLFIFTLIGLIANLISDLTYVLVDPRIDFEKRGS